jgi:aerobic carbon-monoxide dehydrogenase large subunit
MSEADGRMFGAPMKRKEDPRLLRGRGQYVSDIKLHGLLHAAVVRSPHAHAAVRGIDTAACLADPRCVAVLTAADFEELPELACIDAEETTLPFLQPVLARGKVRYVGEPVAVVVAEDRYDAEDLVALVEVDYEPLPAVVDPERALEPDAPILHYGTNLADTLRYSTGDAGGALARAPHVLRERFETQRYAGMPMETRGVIASWEDRTGAITLYSSTQVPNGVKRSLQAALGLPENGVRVIAPDLGGGFGVKLQIYPEEILLCRIAQRIKRPVKWIEDRWEHFVSATHGREQFHDVEVGYDDEGRILGIRDDCLTNTGAYLQSLTLVEPFIGVTMLTGPYRVESFEATARVVVTNKTPMNPFRGVGHVQAAFTMERIVDLIAADLALDPVQVRLRNMITPDQLPLNRKFGNVLAGTIVYDSGDYPACLRRAAELAGHAGFAAERERLRREGRYVGMGFGCFVEETGLGPYESGSVRVEASGKVMVLTGACSSGQGHATTLAQVAADELALDIDDVEVLHGDTDLVRFGVGTYASRTAAVGGAAVRKAAAKVRQRAVFIAGQLLEVDPGDLELHDGAFSVAGSPAVSVSLADVAAAVAPGGPLPEGVESYGLEATEVFHPETNTFAYGVHVATVEVDIETGVVTHLRHVVVNDSGRVINPLILEGQVQGGVAFGVGGALLEEILYDDEGQPRNPNFMDYLVPSIENVSPEILVEHMETPTPLNPDGVKGGGEGGAVGAPAAIANAVADAIRPARVTATPLFPARVHEAIVAAGLSGAMVEEPAP